jgi:hypothetical protein
MDISTADSIFAVMAIVGVISIIFGLSHWN